MERNKQAELPPDQVIKNIDAMLGPLKKQRRKLNRMAFMFFVTGILLTGAITYYFYSRSGSITLWGAPALIVGGFFGYACVRLRNTADLQVRALRMAKAGMAEKAENE